eukprot:464441-Amphidinium_carterae.1
MSRVELNQLGMYDSEEHQYEQAHILSLDAIKCFDRITHASALKEGEVRGTPLPLLRQLAHFYMHLNCRFSMSGFLSQDTMHRCRGLPQGCPLSVWLCNLLGDSWAKHIESQHHDVQPSAFIDDRTLVCASAEELQA